MRAPQLDRIGALTAIVFAFSSPMFMAPTLASPLQEAPVAQVLVAAAPISAKLQVITVLPSTDLPVEPIVSVLAVPQFAVVIAALPLKLVPLIVLAVCNVVAVPALPVQEVELPPALPVTFILHVPLAPVPVNVGE